MPSNANIFSCTAEPHPLQLLATPECQSGLLQTQVQHQARNNHELYGCAYLLWPSMALPGIQIDSRVWRAHSLLCSEYCDGITGYLVKEFLREMGMSPDQIHRCFQKIFKKSSKLLHQQNFRRHINKDIHVTVRTIVSTCHGTEQTQPGNTIHTLYIWQIVRN